MIQKIEDASLVHMRLYSVRGAGEVWHHQHYYDSGSGGFFEHEEDINPIAFERITHVIEDNHLDRVLNAMVLREE